MIIDFLLFQLEDYLKQVVGSLEVRILLHIK